MTDTTEPTPELLGRVLWLLNFSIESVACLPEGMEPDTTVEDWGKEITELGETLRGTMKDLKKALMAIPEKEFLAMVAGYAASDEDADILAAEIMTAVQHRDAGGTLQ